ncbi:hypothetical protein FKM82_017007 [Ascaphus truei]
MNASGLPDCAAVLPDSTAVLPDSTAVSAALEHFLEIEKQLKDGESAISGEAVLHLVAAADAVKDLEHVRRIIRELLEIETINTSKLRYKVLHLPGIITKEIEAAVLSARELNALEMTQLQTELRNRTLELERVGQKKHGLEEKNSFLCDQEKTLWNEYQQGVDSLNQQMAEKAHQSILLNEMYNKRKDALQAVIEFQCKIEDLAKDMIIERQQFLKEKEILNAKITEMEKKIKAQMVQNLEKKECLGELTSILLDVEEKINREKETVRSVKDEILLLQASHARLTNKLDIQNKTTLELSNKKDNLELYIPNLKEDFKKEADSLNERILELDEEMKTAEQLNKELEIRNKDLEQKYQAVRADEDNECAKKQHLTNKLQQATRGLDQKVEHVGKLKMEMKEMKEEMENLQESSKICAERLAVQLVDLKEKLENEQKNRMSLQVHKDEVLKAMELWNLAEEKFMNEMNQRIENGKKRRLSLIEEGTRLQRDIKEWDEQIRRLTAEQTKAKEEHSNAEQRLNKEIKMLEEQLEIVNGNLRAEQETLAGKTSTMKEAEEIFTEEHRKYEDAKKQAAELKTKQKSLVESIKTISKDIEIMLKMKETQKISLKELRTSSFEKLKHYLESISVIEKNIYEANRKLELVIMENCRLKLRLAQFKDDIDQSRNEAKKHKSSTKQMERDVASLQEHLHRGWEKDTFVCNDFCERDQEILDAIMELITKINHREMKVGYLNSKLQGKFIGLASLLESKASLKHGM